MKNKVITLGFVSLGLLSQTYAAFDVRVSVTNNAQSDGLYFTPVWSAFHNGSFDLFDSGSLASAGLAELAETGSQVTLNADFGSADGRIAIGLTSASGIGPGLFDPGRTASFDITLDEANNRYFSFASMLLPSNDAFIGNGDPLSNELFDAMGSFNGPITITLFGSDVHDAGSELNNTLDAAFSMIGGSSTETNVGIASHLGLDNFIGTTLDNNVTLGQAFTGMTPIATITVSAVPEPSTYAAITGILSICAVGFMRRRNC